MKDRGVGIGREITVGELDGLRDRIRAWFTRKEGFVYVVKCEEFYKIGIAKDVEHRLKELVVSNPYELKLILKFYTLNARRIEQSLHDKYRKNHVRGEWFKLSKDELYEILYLGDVEVEKYENHWEAIRSGRKQLGISYLQKYGLGI